MSLKEYARKRDFSKTPEPAPERQAEPAPQRRFFVQRHDATRLHYDFRLEIDGTLKSWAVPKGPSLQPLHKGLAMHVEDHPLSYGDFEGNIPKGEYGGGSVMLWDRGTFELLGDKSGREQIEKGDLKIRLHGEKLNGDFALVRMKNRGKGNEWLLIKKKDEFADPEWDIEALAFSVKTGRSQEEIANELPAKIDGKTKAKKSAAVDPSSVPGAKAGPMPASITPMAAFPATNPPPGKNWIYEIKWDGVRAICFIEKQRIRMCSRNGNSFDRQYPELSVVPNFVDAATAILDGEIAVLDSKGRSSFSLIQPRIHQTDPNSVAHLVRSTPVKLFVFDLLYLNGYDLRGVALRDRKALLDQIINPCPQMQLSQHFEVPGNQMLDAARQMGLEGVMAKLGDSKYEERRSKAWLKIKLTGQQEFVICGYTKGERDTFGSLVLGVHDRGKLVYAGNVGTGFDEHLLNSLYQRLLPLKTSKCPFGEVPQMKAPAIWVKPEIVCEVKFTEWTPEGRLRAPVFVGLRIDKTVAECTRERAEGSAEPVAEPEQDGPLFPEKAKEITLRLNGHSIKFTNLNKVLFPKDGFTKRDILNYYDAVSELIIPHLEDRPLSLKRYPNGIHEDYFFQKDIPETYPDWLRTEPIHSEHRGDSIRFAICNDRATLLYLANLACIDQNPWMSRIGSLEFPDFILIDLDPLDCTYDKIIEAAQLVHEVLDSIGLEGYPKTTGGDGLHIYIPIEARYTYDQARSFAEILSQLVIPKKPDLFTTPRAVAKRRKGRVYFDYLQISTGKTIAAPYVLRAHDGAPVATPLAWDEVKQGLRPDQFTLQNAVDRFKDVGDLFKPVLTKKQKLEPALRKLAKMMGQ